MKMIAPLLLVLLVLLPSSFLGQAEGVPSDKILFITSNQSTYGDSDKKTSNHFGEIVWAYDVFTKAGYVVDIVSPNGGNIPIGYFNDKDTLLAQYHLDSQFMQRFERTFKPSEVVPSDYKAVYYSGGGAAMFGIPYNKSIKNISEEIYENEGIVSAVCHGTAGITQLKAKDGSVLYRNKKVSGFPDAFEKITAAYFKTFPFSIETEVKNNGGNFAYSKQGWDGFYVSDGQLITGQDPTASALVAHEVVRKLKLNHKH